MFAFEKRITADQTSTFFRVQYAKEVLTWVVSVDAAKYLVRVELHSATYDDYETRHRAMAARGFQRTIRSGQGTFYDLPTAEYTIGSAQSGEQVRTAADNAASTTGKRHGLLVVRYDEAWWTGLT